MNLRLRFSRSARWVPLGCLFVTWVSILVLPLYVDVKREVACFALWFKERKPAALHTWIAAGDTALDVGRWQLGAPPRSTETENPRAALLELVGSICPTSQADETLLAEVRQTLGRPNLFLVGPETFERYAVAFFRRAFELDPTSADAKQGLADAEAELVVALQAPSPMEWLKARLETDAPLQGEDSPPSSVEAIVAKAKQDEAEANVNPVAASQRVWREAEAALARRDYDTAVIMLNYSNLLDPTNAEVERAHRASPSLLVMAARNYADVGRFNEAETKLRQAQALDPENADARRFQQWIQERRILIDTIRREISAGRSDAPN